MNNITALDNQTNAKRKFDIKEVRSDFPILNEKVHNQSLIYLDNGATSQKPQTVIDAIDNYYQHFNSNVHRGAHALSDKATELFENARVKVQNFIRANSREEIIWTRGTTESINLVAQTWGRENIGAGDEIIVTTLEHHSNIVPWQILCESVGARLLPVNIKTNGELDYEHFTQLLSAKTKLVAVGHISNALGVINPVEDMIKAAHQVGAKVLIDGAQAAPHLVIDVQQLDCDFYAFSGHKMFAPTGIGVLYGKRDLLDAMPPWHGGGEMIEKVSFSGTTFNKLPYKFEAGTPNIEGSIAMAAAIDYLEQFDRDGMTEYEMDLINYATEKAQSIPEMKIIGSDCNKTSVLSFIIEGCHSQDVGMILDQQGIAVRTGHHCAMPLMDALDLKGTIRASFSFYNTKQEVDKLFEALEKAKQFLM
ncbi:aminotransferase class V-fold PLP-dependent enzyme [Aliikangiella coralliicola]|uniref:Cysteine desulfurase n=1 Tax=Aliikangiella coralliicola TaxID=2592383 RepID=A0A545UDG2_9GAMM|nr:cysteine desulfurase [Aliikangiella coralliicola]TQV87506.1 cysteine desulfurase [Aliikangiella coralliicola]